MKEGGLPLSYRACLNDIILIHQEGRFKETVVWHFWDMLINISSYVFQNFQSSSLEFQKDIWKREQIFRHNKLTSSVGFFQTKQKGFSIHIFACLYYVFLLCSIHNQDKKKKNLFVWVVEYLAVSSLEPLCVPAISPA